MERRIKLIERFKPHPKYEAALGIIRAKITGPASDVLTNNKTAYNIADQRPLYIREAEMTSIRQLKKTLQEYYDAIYQAFNIVISKIVLTSTHLNEQKPLIEEAQQKAIRTFIIGLKSQATRTTPQVLFRSAEYDIILGEQGLRQMKAIVNFFEYKIYYQKSMTLHKINYTNDCSK